MVQPGKSNSGDTPKAIDVVAPGKTPPSPSGKPIIVTNRPMVKDPMTPGSELKSVSGALHPVSRVTVPITSTLLAPTSIGPNQEQSTVSLPGRRVMKSISVIGDTPAPPAKPDEVAAKPETANAEQEPETPQQPSPADSTDSTSSKEAASEPAQSEDSSAATAPSSDVPLADNAKERAEKEAEARLAEQEKIIAGKQYYLPIKDAEKHRGNSRAVLWLLLALLAVLVWLDLVLDAGVVHISGVHALTHFFNS